MVCTEARKNLLKKNPVGKKCAGNLARNQGSSSKRWEAHPMKALQKRTEQRKIKRARECHWFWSLEDNHVLYLSYTPTSLPIWCSVLEPRPLLYLMLTKYLFQPCSLAHASEVIFILKLMTLVRPLAIVCKYAEHFSTPIRRNGTKDSYNTGHFQPTLFRTVCGSLRCHFEL